MFVNLMRIKRLAYTDATQGLNRQAQLRSFDFCQNCVASTLFPLAWADYKSFSHFKACLWRILS